MTMKFSLIVIIGALVIASCESNNEVAKNYFDIDSLIDRQLAYLEENGARLSKTASIDCATDTTTFNPDSASWAKELEVFRHLDIINKPIYADAYKVTDGVKDINSNLIVRSFIAKRDIPVKNLKLYYQDSPKKLRKLDATLSEQNSLYYTTRKLSIVLEDINKQMVISSYDVRGIQKMTLRDSVRFSISSKVIY